MEQLEDLESNLENKILKITAESVNKGMMTDEEAGDINSLAREGDINTALDKLEKIYEEQNESLSFDDEEKDKFAEAFGEAIDNLEDSILEFRDELESLEEGVSKRDMRQYLYGGKSSRTHKDVDDLFDSIDSVSAGGISDRKMAKILHTYSSRLNISELEALVSEMREKKKEA